MFCSALMLLSRSFLYIEKDQDCVTLPGNSKTDQILRRMSAVLYEKKGMIYFITLQV